MIRQRASAPGTKERRSRQQQQQNILPQYQQYQQQQQQHPVSSQPQDNTLSWERDEEVATWSIATNNSGDDLVDEELGGEPDLPIPQTSIPASLPATASASYPAAAAPSPAAAIPTQPSYYRTLYFQIPDSKYREHHHQQQQQRIHHHRKVRLAQSSSSPSSPPSSLYSNSKTNKYRFLYFFSSPHMFARALGWYSVVAMLFLLFVGLLIDLQPLYIRGVLPRSTLQNPRALRKFKVLIPSGSSAARLEPAKHAYQAALAYFVTACACWIYGYHWIERAWARIRRRHYKDIPDHYYPDDILNHNNHHHHSKDGNFMSKVVSTCAPHCSRCSSRSRRFCQSICRSSNAGTRHSNQTPPWQGRCLAFILWSQRLFGTLGEVLLMAIRRTSASMRYSSTKRTRTRRSSTAAASSNSSLTIPSGNAATTTTTANTTATQRKRRKNTAAASRNESQSPPNTGASETIATTSSGKHKHG